MVVRDRCRGFNPQAVLSFCFLLIVSSLSLADAAQNSSHVAGSTTPTNSASPTSASVSRASSPSAHVSSSLARSSGSTVLAQPSVVPPKPGQLPNSFPHNYTEIPAGDFSPAWQEFFLVTQGLPNITFPLPHNYAGNIPVSRPNNTHPNNTLFFWGVESTQGSLTAQSGQLQLLPWMIWLGGGGGPGSSSLFTSMTANGPMLLHNDFTITQNQFGFSGLMDMFWVDQPVGTGFSTVDSDGYVKDENQVASDFIGFLSNLVKVFPSLASRPLILAGEDYAGIFIPYIVNALFTSSSPPVQLHKIVIGNGLIGGFDTFPNLATISILESFPQLIKFDQNVFKSFQAQAHLCGFDLNLTYPQAEPLPSFSPTAHPSSFWSFAPNEVPSALDRREILKSVLDKRHFDGSKSSGRSIGHALQSRQSSELPDALTPSYGCALFDEMIDYAANFSFPWTPGNFDLYDIPNVVSPQASLDAGVYFNSIQVRGALHAPLSKNWSSVPTYPFGSTTNFSSTTNIYGDPSPAPASFFNDLVSTAESKGVGLVFYSGANNAIANHHALELLIQNATFGGTRGFTRKPATPWNDDNGDIAGIVHQERGIVYALFDNVGHLIPHWKPNAAYVFYRDFVMNANGTGSITVDSNNNLAVLGGEDPTRADDAPRIATALYLGSATTASTLFAPAATVQAWSTFLGNIDAASVQNGGVNAAPSLWMAGMLGAASLTIVWLLMV